MEDKAEEAAERGLEAEATTFRHAAARIKEKMESDKETAAMAARGEPVDAPSQVFASPDMNVISDNPEGGSRPPEKICKWCSKNPKFFHKYPRQCNLCGLFQAPKFNASHGEEDVTEESRLCAECVGAACETCLPNQGMEWQQKCETCLSQENKRWCHLQFKPVEPAPSPSSPEAKKESAPEPTGSSAPPGYGPMSFLSTWIGYALPKIPAAPPAPPTTPPSASASTESATTAVSANNLTMLPRVPVDKCVDVGDEAACLGDSGWRAKERCAILNPAGVGEPVDFDNGKPAYGPPASSANSENPAVNHPAGNLPTSPATPPPSITSAPS